MIVPTWKTRHQAGQKDDVESKALLLRRAMILRPEPALAHAGLCVPLEHDRS